MRKIFDRMVYDTEKAEVIAKYSNGLSGTDFECVREVLHRTKKKRFFLYGEGGALSIYGETVGRNRFSSEIIIPLSDEEALSWLIKRNEIENIEKLFGGLEEA